MNLPLTKEEADLLVTILSYVGGDKSGPRGIVDEISNKLIHEGANPFFIHRELCIKGDIHFVNYVPKGKKGTII
jgi:hypothetical protein